MSRARGVADRLRRYVWLSRAVLAPKERFFPGLGARLSAHPRIVASMLRVIGRLPGRRLRAAARRDVSQPLLRRIATQLDVPVSRFRMRVDTADAMGRVLAVEGVWEPHVTAVFHARLSRGDVCVDVGANVGYYTLLAAELVGPEGHVYALEPAPRTHAALVANIELNGYANVTALCTAAGEAPGEAVLDGSAQSVRAAIRRTNDDATGFRVPVQPVSSLVPAADVRRLRLIKIDVEGYELQVLRGVEPLLEQGARPAVLVELHAGHGQDAAMLLLELSREYRLKPNVVTDDNGVLRLEPWVDHTIHSSGPHILLTA